MRARTELLGLLLITLCSAPACAPGGLDPSPDGEEEEEVSDASEDELSEPGFDRNRVLSDAAFVDWQAMTEAEIQAFLDETPYGNRSALASYTSGGMSAARAIRVASESYRINPLVILTRLQMEQSLIGKTSASKKALDFAFGCGCPDNGSCSETWRGFHKQADCMASHMRSYLDDLEGGGSTIAGWKVGKAKKTLDPQWVTPKNMATAALYTYTPWVGSSGFGNLGHFQIWKRFAGHIGYAPIGPGGCAAVTFPSGMTVQSLPSDAMTEAYVDRLGFSSAGAPACFLDPAQLVDPTTEGTWPSSSKVSSNFAFSELIKNESSSRQVLVDPALVSTLQAMRTKVGAAISVVEAFRSPERHLDVCVACDAELPMTVGLGAIVTSSAGSQKLLDAAKTAGAPTCWARGGEVYVDMASPGRGCPSAAP
ncbi:MAG: hypothetical protein IPG04_27145 [Polyangiaceae bacterium]|jgi:hypothetical protein|nr:hypothetical protein [Polyangiaceae bacterium]